MIAVDLVTVLEDAPAGEWVALSSGLSRIMATAKTLEAAMSAARLQGEENPVMMKAPSTDALVL
jgi:hypothetical protein